MPSAERADRVLDLVRGLTAEVRPHASHLTVTLDSPFDDLGIGSLELAELLLRLQDAFSVSLPPHVLGSAETPRDLLRAVARSHAVDAGRRCGLAPTADGGQPAAGTRRRVDPDRRPRLAPRRDRRADTHPHPRRFGRL